MHFREGFREWRHRYLAIATRTSGIERVVGYFLHALTLLSPTQWRHIGFGRERDRSVDTWTEWYVILGLAISIVFFRFPSQAAAWLSTYFSAVTLIAVLNIVFLQRVFETIVSPQRSLLLFMCNVAQIVLMFATWYSVLGVEDPLLKSVLTFATISYSADTPRIAIAQIATDFILLAVYLSHLVGRVGGR
ncbi:MULTISPECIES: hypothetical protein [unclassified Bradyrhizobium]|uniref:hypothetical protein n=1 Tax=unclassified Bradyrhizobium TaxID=2631580 RepID=UPI0028E80D4E|nr:MULTISPECIES: hypothetical protein [unclassified Bradyrhizobium]